MTSNIQILVKNVYGAAKAYPANDTARKVADLVGMTTLTRPKLCTLLSIGFTLEVMNGFGGVAKTFTPGEPADLSFVS